jgi:hypothetical protein
VLRLYYLQGGLDGFTISGGSANGSGENNRGGGIYAYCGAPLLANLIVSGNEAVYGGGGIFVHSSGCSTPGSFPSLLNVTFDGNSADYGGGMYLFGSSPDITNAVFVHNIAGAAGDGIYDYHSSPTLTNVSMGGDRIYNDINSDPILQNSILWEWGLPGDTIINADAASVPTLLYSLAAGCNPDGVWDSACGADGGHNLSDADPDYTAEVPPDLRLQSTSPAIDAGDNTLIPPYVTPTDLDGNPRIVGASADLGAYEYQSILTEFDLFLPTVMR